MEKNGSTMIFYRRLTICLSSLIFFLLCSKANATAIPLDNILHTLQNYSSQWQAIFIRAASYLFWSLVTISMVWTFGILALRKADLGEFFVEFFKFTISTGLHWWMLIKGPYIAGTIINSLRMLAGQASGMGSKVNPQSLIELGFSFSEEVVSKSSLLHPVNSAIMIIISLIVLVLLTLIAINITLLICSAWITSYAGIFYLGFGGCRWTSDIAINYYRTIIGIASKIMGMLLLAGLSKNILDHYIQEISKTEASISSCTAVFITTLIIFCLINKVPDVVSSILSGANFGHNIGNMGGSSVMNSMPMISSMGRFASSQALGVGYTTAKSSIASARSVYNNSDYLQSKGLFQGSSTIASTIANNKLTRFGADMSYNLAKATLNSVKERSTNFTQSNIHPTFIGNIGKNFNSKE